MFVVLTKRMDYGGEYYNVAVYGPYKSEDVAYEAGPALKQMEKLSRDDVTDYEVLEINNGR